MILPLSRPGISLSTFALVFAACGAAPPPPRLVVVITVDQMRADYLDRFAPYFTGGFARMLGEGVVYTDGHQDHALTVTAAGHATIGTGVFPSRHGIVGNDFFDRTAGRPRYCADDSTSSILGYPSAPGRSPANLLRSTVGDWLKAAFPTSKVYGVAVKDRAAILAAGRDADAAYWYHYPAGRFVSSAYYHDANPEWVDAFNASGRAESYFDVPWTKLLPDSAYRISRRDDFPSEADGRHTTFPHRAGELGSGLDASGPSPHFFTELPRTPFGDELTLAFARDLIENEQLGADEVPDMLFLGLSSTDFIGHAYGPYSQEIQDHHLRVDAYLGEFFEFLDELVGEGRWAAVLSGDHGVMPMPEELIERGIDAARVDPRPIRETLRQVIGEAVDDGVIANAPRLRSVNGLAFQFEQTPDSAAAARLRTLLARALSDQDAVERTFTYEELMAADVADAEPLGAFRRSFHPDRSPDVALHYPEYRLVSGGTTQTSHGSAYRYDTHVPMVFVGPGLTAATVSRRVRTVDIAPTIAAILGIVAPSDLDGVVLPEASRTSSSR